MRKGRFLYALFLLQESDRMDYFKPNMSPAAVNAVSMLGLAHIGDAVYEVMTRAALCEEGHTAVQELHRRTTARVNAPAQAEAAARILPVLDEEESAIYRRGRNAHGMSDSITPRRGLRPCSAGCICRGGRSGSTSCFPYCRTASQKERAEKCPLTPYCSAD